MILRQGKLQAKLNGVAWCLKEKPRGKQDFVLAPSGHN